MMIEDKTITTVLAEKRWADKGSIQVVVYLDDVGVAA